MFFRVFFVCIVSGVLLPTSSFSQTLLIHGGGSQSEACDQAFLAAAGKGPRLVVIPTASSLPRSPASTKETWKIIGFKQVAIFHASDRGMANDREFVASLENADAIWFSGGDQSRLAERYVGTLVEEKILKLNRKGVVVGGSSAGAAIQSKIMIAGGKQKPKLAAGFDLLPGAIIDQHFLARSRMNRLINAVKQHPDKMGIGIDERTSITVSSGKAKVSGKGYVITIRQVDGELDIQSYEPGSEFDIPG